MIKYIDHHVHTCNSVLDGMVKIDEYVKFGKENNFPALFISDHGNMDGAINFYLECRANDIKPIIGSEFYISEAVIDKDNESTKFNYHLCLYAKNLTGYKNLIKLTTWANLNNFYMKPRITFEQLQQHHEGLICTTACIGSQWGYLIEHDMLKDAGMLAAKFKQLFGNDFYIELGYHKFARQIKYIQIMDKIAKQLGVKTLIGNDVHYLKKEENFAHKIIMCKGFGKTIADSQKDSDNFNYDENYYKTSEEITEIFSPFSAINTEQCFQNTYEIINKVENYEIKFGEYIYPELPNTNGLSQTQYLFNLIKEGCKRRYPNGVPSEVVQRIQYEFGVIDKMNFCGYFNMVHDYINWAKDNGVETGCARGSCGGCMIAYIIGITELNSMKYGLYFERFLNPDRVSFPDIDTDFEPEGRAKLIQYLTEKYGQTGCVPISTRGYLKGKSAIKTVASKMGLNFMKYNSLLSEVDGVENDSIDKMLENDLQIKKAYETDTEFQEVVKLAKQVEGNIQSVGVHASGVIVCHKDISDVCPIIKTKDGYTTAFTDKIVEKLGLIKYDLLGLKNLAIMKEAFKRLDGFKFAFDKMPYNDPKTYDLISKGNTLGVFQFESEIMKRLCRDIQPQNLEDLAVINAGARPGALESGLTESYINRRKGTETIVYETGMEQYLEETLGLYMFQEQVMLLSRVMAGYTMAEADELRKIIGKKLVDKLAPEREKFIKGCITNGHNEQKANEIFDTIEKFGRYGFNKCLDGDTWINEWGMTINKAYKNKVENLKLQSYNTDTKELFKDEVVEIIPTGQQEVYEFELDNGKTITCTLEHKFLCIDGTYHAIKYIMDYNLEMVGI